MTTTPPTEKRTILIQLDGDAQPSVFDRVVAIDAGVDELFSYGGITVPQVQGLVYGAMFTRGPVDLRHTAIFVGGSDVALGETILAEVTKTFFGPLRVSVMLDANGANTTAAAAVVAAGKHLSLAGVPVLVLGGTGPVGQRAARLLAREGAKVSLGSRSLDRANQAAAAINMAVGGNHVTGCAAGDDLSVAAALRGPGVQLVIAAGATGVKLLSLQTRQAARDLRVAIDLNAVPPAGIEGVDAMDKGKDRGGVIAYGALGVGSTKMKTHKAAIAKLFESNDKVLDAEAIYEIAKGI